MKDSRKNWNPSGGEGGVVRATKYLTQEQQKVEEQLAESEKGRSVSNNKWIKCVPRCKAGTGNRTQPHQANTFVEQLQEMQQSLKHILENLPEEYDEEEWRVELEKTSASLQRLGAVNLAAVEEYSAI